MQVNGNLLHRVYIPIRKITTALKKVHYKNDSINLFKSYFVKCCLRFLFPLCLNSVPKFTIANESVCLNKNLSKYVGRKHFNDGNIFEWKCYCSIWTLDVINFEFLSKHIYGFKKEHILPFTLHHLLPSLLVTFSPRI